MNTLLLLALFFFQAPAAVQSPNGAETTSLREPAGLARLSGHVRGLKDFASLPIALHSTSGAPRETSPSADGSFKFENVPAGSYTLQAPGFVSLDITVGSSSLTVDLEPLYSGPGATVRGKVTDRSQRLHTDTTRTVTLSPLFTGPTGAASVSSLGGSLGGSLKGALETWVRPDGKFEFPAVPPGSYMLRTAPAAAGTSRRVEIGGASVTDLDITIPYQLETTGRVLLEGRDLGPNATVEATQPTFTNATGIHADGSFKLRLNEGENQVNLTRLPPQFSVKKISYGSLDITHSPLKIDSRTVAQEIVISLENTAIGHLESRNVDSIVQSGTHVAGRVVVVDAEGNPYPFRPGISMIFRLPNSGLTSTAVRPDGTFGIALNDNEYIARIGNLPEGYTVKSISSGILNLLENTLVVNAKAVPDNIEVVLEYTPRIGR